MTACQWISAGYAVVFRDGRVWLAHAGNVWTLPLDWDDKGWESQDNLAEWALVQDAGHLVGWVGPHPRDVMLYGARVRVPPMLALRRACACTAEFHCGACSGLGVMSPERHG